jgi:hypothetical protein
VFNGQRGEGDEGDADGEGEGCGVMMDTRSGTLLPSVTEGLLTVTVWVPACASSASNCAISGLERRKGVARLRDDGRAVVDGDPCLALVPH